MERNKKLNEQVNKSKKVLKIKHDLALIGHHRVPLRNFVKPQISLTLNWSMPKKFLRRFC